MTDVFSALPAHELGRLRAIEDGDFGQLVARRIAGEPLQYIEGTAAFLDFEVAVDHRVLVPRPETEGLFELAAGAADSPRRVVDLGTGSGVLAIAAARRYPSARVHAIDASADALSLARQNAEANGVGVRFHLGDLFEALPSSLRGSIDLLVSNPPYVATEDMSSLPADVRREPPLALDGGPGGFAVLARIAAESSSWLAPGAVVVCEIGDAHGDLAMDHFGGLGEASVYRDLTGRVRYVKVAL